MDPAANSPNLAVARQVDDACDDFERRWREGERPRIEDHVSTLPESMRTSMLRALLSVELELLSAPRRLEHHGDRDRRVAREGEDQRSARQRRGPVRDRPQRAVPEGKGTRRGQPRPQERPDWAAEPERPDEVPQHPREGPDQASGCAAAEEGRDPEQEGRYPGVTVRKKPVQRRAA